MELLRQTLNRIEIGSPRARANLTMFPLLDDALRAPDYATLAEALDEGWVEITEVSQGGSVPDLKLANHGDRAVFLLDGEELIGAKQNRVLNLTILAPAGQTLVIPVSCVEQGRWAHVSRRFSSSNQTMYAAVRAAKLGYVSESMAQGRRTSDQASLWSAIRKKAGALDACSPTIAMSAIYDRCEQEVHAYVEAFQAEERQHGAMFAIGGRLVGFDLFEHSDVLRRMLPKLVRSFALDAIETAKGSERPSHDDAVLFVREVADAEAKTFSAVGLGSDVRLHGPRIAGAALVLDDHVIHLNAFRTP